jgi:hypothetical protein
MVVDGVFGECGGIAEDIDIRVVQVTQLLQGATQPKSSTEFGADPILRTQGSPVPDSSLGPVLRIIGPIGHTFDVDALAPAFASTSFIVMPPAFAEQDPGAGWMAKLRARRVIDPRGVVGYGKTQAVAGYEAQLINVPSATRLAESPPDSDLSDPVPLSGNDDLSITFDNLPLAVGRTIAITIVADRAGDLPFDQSHAAHSWVASPPSSPPATIFPQEWSVLLSETADGTNSTTRITFGNMVISVPDTPAAVRILVVTRRVEANNEPIDKFDVTLEAIDSQGNIIRGGEITFEDAPASGAVRLRFSSSSTDATLIAKILRAPLASDWSETGWTQFLPDTSVHLRDNNGSATLTLPDQATTSEITVNASRNVAWRTLYGLPGRHGEDDQGLAHFLLLTRTVPSFAGADEAYVGIYVLKTGPENGITAQFVPFVTAPEIGYPIDLKSFSARILLVQADPQVWRAKSSADLDSWMREFGRTWDAFFPPETIEGSNLANANAKDALLSPRDADLRILTVFAPFQCANGSQLSLH